MRAPRPRTTCCCSSIRCTAWQSQRRPSTASGGTGGSQRLVCGGGSSSGNVAGSAQQLPTEHATQRQQHQHHTLGDERGSNGRPASAGATSYLTRIQTTLPTLRPQPGQPPAQPLPVFQPASHRDRPTRRRRRHSSPKSLSSRRFSPKRRRLSAPPSGSHERLGISTWPQASDEKARPWQRFAKQVGFRPDHATCSCESRGRSQRAARPVRVVSS